MTPFEMEILMHHHTSSAKFPRPTDLYWDTVNRFQDMGVLDNHNSAKGVMVTELGKVWLKQILSTPCPRKVTVYLDHNNKVIGRAKEQ